MLVRSRSARKAGIAALAVAAPILASATPVFAVGDDAEVHADLTTTPGSVHLTSTKGLSRTTIVLCGGATLVIPSWAGDVLSGDVPIPSGGIVRAVFQHSGNNTTAAAKTLLADLAGDSAVSGNSTGAIAYDAPDACNTDGGNTDGGNTDGGNTDGGNTDGGNTDGGNTDGENTDGGNTDGGNTDGGNTDTGGDRGEDGGETPAPVTVTDPAPTTTSDPAPTTTGDPAPTTASPADPAPATVLPITAQPAGEIPTLVLGETVVRGGELPRTGSGDVQPLMLMALSLVGTGLALRAGSQRIRSASFPG